MTDIRDCSMCSGPGEVYRCLGLPRAFTYEIQCACCGMRSAPSVEPDQAKATEQLAPWWNAMHGWIEAGKIRDALGSGGIRI